MLNRLMLVTAAVVCISWQAFGRASYPQFTGEMGFSVADNNLETDATEYTLYYRARFPNVILDERVPNELQPWAHRRSSIAIGMATVDYDSPANESKSGMALNAMDFRGRDIGLTISYVSADLSASAADLETPRYASFTQDLPSVVDRDEVTSVGVILNKFPSYLMRIDLDFNSYRESGANNDWDVAAIAIGTHPVDSRMWLETGLSSTFRNSWGDHTDFYVTAVGYAGKTTAIGASLAAVFKGDSNRGSGLIFVRFSGKKAKVDFGIQRDMDNDGGSAMSLAAAYRF